MQGVELKPESVSSHASTALAFAADNGHLDIVQTLVESGYCDVVSLQKC